MITLREQNKMLSNNYNHRVRIENDLKKRIEQLETTLRLCEDKEPENQLTIVNEQLRNRVDELEFELNKVRLNERRLNNDLDCLNKEFNDIRRKFLQANPDSIRNSTSTSYSNQNNHQNTNSTISTGDSNIINNTPSNIDEISQTKTIQDLETKLADQTELANNRLKELDELQEQHKNALITLDNLKLKAKCIPKEVVVETPEYRTLQSHFSVLYNEATQLKTQLLDSKELIIRMKDSHANQIDRMERDEAKIHKELRTNIIDLEQSLTETRNRFSGLRVEYDNLAKAQEQTVKLDTELKKSLSAYKVQMQQKNNDIARLKRLLEDTKRERNHTETKGIAHATNNEFIHQLQKQLDKKKSEEDALMSELEITGQAYEDVQEQNHRLLQQIEEKDDANLALMTEQYKVSTYHSKLKEEKNGLLEITEKQTKYITAQGNVIRSLEEKVKLLQDNMSSLERELVKRNKGDITIQEETAELKQKLEELNSEKEKVSIQLSEMQRLLSDRTASDTHQSFKNKRLTEELEAIKKKYERASKLQSASTPDEVLMEEIREYKEQLTCPSCKTAPKDAVLTKCFHVFCYECLKARVDTRQRKCPKCNAQFGASDFHRLYLA